jgi:hypothetical protein
MYNCYNDSYSCSCGFTVRTNKVGLELYMDDFFSSPDLPEDLHIKKLISVILSHEIKKECPGILKRD